MSEVPYLETEALLAAMDGDHDRFADIVAHFLPNELAVFSDQLQLARDLVIREQRRRAVAGEQ